MPDIPTRSNTEIADPVPDAASASGPSGAFCLMLANKARAETLPALEIPSSMFREWLSTAGLPDLAEGMRRQARWMVSLWSSLPGVRHLVLVFVA